MDPVWEQINPRLDFQIAPEAGVFFTTQRVYPTTFRHVNCAECSRTTHLGTSFPVSCSCRIPVKITIESGQLEDRGRQLLEVCPGGCNGEEEPNNGDFDTTLSSATDEDIAAILYDETRAHFEAVHGQRPRDLDIIRARIVWNRNSPMPAYFSPRQEAHHSS
jgi:hypothetical protein